MVSATIRDIAIIIIAIQTIVIGVLLGVLIWQIWRLVSLIQREIQPILTDTQETLNNVRGTTTFVSNNVVDPVVKGSSALAPGAYAQTPSPAPITARVIWSGVATSETQKTRGLRRLERFFSTHSVNLLYDCK
jgi:hypothetical protein